MNLTGKMDVNITNKTLSFGNHTIHLNITDITIEEMHLDPTFKLM